METLSEAPYLKKPYRPHNQVSIAPKGSRVEETLASAKEHGHLQKPGEVPDGVSWRAGI